jgi:MscS family membrane protein
MRIWAERASKTESKLDDQFVPIARKTLKTFVFVIGAVIIIQRLGYSAESIIAGLGLGSLALALAAKDTVANLFGSLVIFIDRPFQMGDWVEIGSNEGLIEEVNLRTTRLRTFTNSLITIPNQQLTTQAIVNWSAMRKRRVKLVLPLSRHSQVRQIRDVLAAIRQLLASDPDILQDLVLVNLSTIDEKSFGILICFHSRLVKWVEYMAHQERVLLAVLEKLEEMGMEVGMPSTEVRLLPEKTQS